MRREGLSDSPLFKFFILLIFSYFNRGLLEKIHEFPGFGLFQTSDQPPDRECKREEVVEKICK